MIRTAAFALFLFASAVFAVEPVGEYVGSYASNGGEAHGTTKSSFKKGPDSAWDCKFLFSPDGGEEVAAKSVSCSVADNKLTAQYTAPVEGGEIKITLTGTIAADGSLSGAYKAVGDTGDVVDTGTWKSSPHP